MKLINCVKAALLVWLGVMVLTSDLLKSILAVRVTVDVGEYGGIWLAAIIIAVVGLARLWINSQTRTINGSQQYRRRNDSKSTED